MRSSLLLWLLIRNPCLYTFFSLLHIFSAGMHVLSNAKWQYAASVWMLFINHTYVCLWIKKVANIALVLNSFLLIHKHFVPVDMNFLKTDIVIMWAKLWYFLCTKFNNSRLCSGRLYFLLNFPDADCKN